MSADLHTSIINTQLTTSIAQTVRKVALAPQKEYAVMKKMNFLKDIEHIHSTTDHQLYQELVEALKGCQDLYCFEVERMLQAVLQNYISQCNCFREAYEISVLRKQASKYSHLKIQEPVIKVQIPQPYLSQPLGEARFLGEAKGFTFDSNHI